MKIGLPPRSRERSCDHCKYRHAQLAALLNLFLALDCSIYTHRVPQIFVFLCPTLVSYAAIGKEVNCILLVES